MAERRQYFAWVWPKSDPGPLDGAAVQHRWLRIAPRGALELVALILGSAALACCAAPVALVLLSVATEPVRLIVALGLLGLPLAAALWLLLRGWGAGTFVNDAGVKVAGVFRTVTVPWTDVLRVRRGDSTVVLTLRDRGDTVALNAAHPGWWGRSDDFDIAALALQRWSESA
jgi:hypothetical protein